MDNTGKTYELLQPLGLNPLNKTWAKIEIFLGLTCVFLGMILYTPPFRMSGRLEFLTHNQASSQSHLPVP